MMRVMSLALPIVIRASAIAACCAVIGMLAIYIVSGIGQDPLQFVHAPAEYMTLLVQDPPMLRAVIGLDNLFIAFYTAVFVALGVELLHSGSSRALVATAVGLLFALALLDYAENLHFLVLLANAELGQAPSSGTISLQVFESLIKFHVSYLGLFMLGFALPRRDRRERLLANLSLAVQLPVGVLIYLTPPAISVPLVFVRFGYFVAGLLLIAWIFGGRAASARTEPVRRQGEGLARAGTAGSNARA